MKFVGFSVLLEGYDTQPYAPTTGRVIQPLLTSVPLTVSYMYIESSYECVYFVKIEVDDNTIPLFSS